MSEHEPYDDPSLKGLSRYFNNRTIRGRANVAIATFACIATFIVYKKTGELLVEMAGGGDVVDESKLKGLSRIFNGQTLRGRANVAIATYSAVGLLIAFFALKPKKAKK